MRSTSLRFLFSPIFIPIPLRKTSPLIAPFYVADTAPRPFMTGNLESAAIPGATAVKSRDGPGLNY
jgi:hypothetical protein